MKVILVNGSPNRDGCVNRALQEVEKELKQAGIDTLIMQLGKKPIPGCVACGACKQEHLCKVHDDIVNEFLKQAKDADGFIFGSPVYYAGINGTLKSFMDRVFYAGGHEIFRLKPAAAVTSARRAGTTSTFDTINKYFTISEMPIVASTYWNNVHGSSAEDVEKDLEGLQIMRNLGRNMAYWLQCQAVGASKGLSKPIREAAYRSDFIE